MSSLGKEIGGRTPSKKQINLISTEKVHTNAGRTVVIILLAVLVLAAAGLYTVNLRQTVDSLQTRLWNTQDELLLLQSKSLEYDEVGAEHVRYSFAHLTQEEKNRLTGMMIIKKIEDLVVPYGFVTEMSISGNSVEFTVYSEHIGDVTDSLRSDPDVKSVIPRAESKQESAETITVTEQVSAMIMKTIGGVQVIKRSDDPVVPETQEAAEDTETPDGEVEGEDGTETETAAESEAEAESETEAQTDTVYLNTEKKLEGNKDVQVTIIIPPVMSMAQLKVTFRDLEGN